jgi:mannitol/fructose-specific phosphotransferase system IIA component (Ntr-type)
VLKYFLENGLVNYSKEQPKNWEEAVRMSCDKLIEKNIISNVYVNEIISSVKEHGPYIVIAPNVAMPHATADSKGVFGTAVSFTKFPEQVMFFDSSENEEKPAQLFFTLAAKNPDEHLENITNLMGLLMEEGMVDKLLNTNSVEDYKKMLDANT